MSKLDAMSVILSTERVGRVMTATLSHRPINALDDELIDRLHKVLSEVAADPEIAVLHLRSSERVFCAGADLGAMRACFGTPGGQEAMIETVRHMQRLFARIEDAAVVTLAEIGGAALGGGLELALACDLRVAAAEAKLGLPEVSLGLLPAAGGTQRLTRLAGEGVAKRLILGAETVDGLEAQRLGIVQWVQPRERLASWTSELAARIAAMSKAALLASKRCIAAAAAPGRDGFAEEIESTRDLYAQAETRRKVAEFLERNANRHNVKEIR
jgi:enoyl-CoA hydratase/carnithine racemase